MTSITPAQLAAAKAIQHRAAHDASPQVRLLAGPGTGKSFSIGERVTWLLANGVDPKSVWAISFTNAATNDLRQGIFKYCREVARVDEMHVATLHSLALTLLAKGGMLNYYPVRPRVLDGWEQRHIFDEELAIALRVGIVRCAELRTHFEAMWSTGAPPLPFISTPKAPITAADEGRFLAYYNRTTQIYSCLLPGEAVRKCIDGIRAGTLDPVALTGMTHLVVDEYQDLNLADVEFIDQLIAAGVNVFVCGDDDQSIYSFRYAYPSGIQNFHMRHAGAASHTLPTCFRCASDVLKAAISLIAAFPSAGRLSAGLASAYASSAPPVPGQIVGWKFSSATAEAVAIAKSISELIKAGTPPEEILILVASRGAQLDPLLAALNAAGVTADVQRDVELAGTDGVRFIYAVLRLLEDDDDYLALRTVLGLRKGVGIGTCAEISALCAANSLNFSDQFTTSRSTALFSSRQNKALDAAVAVRALTAGWSDTDLLGARRIELDALVASAMTAASIAEWKALADNLPVEMTLGELGGVLSARTQKDTREKMQAVYERIGVPVPAGLNPAGRVRIMTLHSCKGLSSRVVFIPGLEEEILPGPRRAAYSSQVEEAARLLYVGITRARALCVMSFSSMRTMNGTGHVHHPSRFLPALGVHFIVAPGLTAAEVARTIVDIGNL